jgi:hypothetical protein
VNQLFAFQRFVNEIVRLANDAEPFYRRIH